ncbi:MAG: LytTR family transcriptional regulator [Treponemataceae bacterium]|nr:LytTR family transcriptional regulator [Treponemataceae bacterium]
MKLSIETDEALRDDEICLHVKKVTEKVTRIVDRLNREEQQAFMTPVLTGKKGETVTFLKTENVIRIYSLDKKVYAVAAGDDSDGDYELNLRLYQIEGLMAEEEFKSFIRISNTDIVNFAYLKNMDMSLNGNIIMNLTNGERVFVSRRYMKDIKAKLNIR